MDTKLTRPSNCTHASGILASMSMTFDIDAGMGSYEGCAAAWTVCADGADAIEAASVAAIEVAMLLKL